MQHLDFLISASSAMHLLVLFQSEIQYRSTCIVKIKLPDNLCGFVTDILMPRVRFLEQVILWQDAVIS